MSQTVKVDFTRYLNAPFIPATPTSDEKGELNALMSIQPGWNLKCGLVNQLIQHHRVKNLH